MATLREYARAYRRAGGVPDTPEWYEGAPRSVRLGGALLVCFIGYAVTMVPAVVLIWVWVTLGLPQWLGLIAGLPLIPLAYLSGKFFGGPVVDWAFGIPRKGVPL